MSGRETVLAAIRQGLGRGPLGDAARRALDERQGATDSAPLLPKLPKGPLQQVFRAGLEKVSGTMSEVTKLDEVPGAVAGYLSGHGLAPEAAVAPSLESLDWSGAGIQASFGPTRGGDYAGVSLAWRGVAENGSLVLLSGPENPTSLNFLPDHHIVVLHGKDLVPHLEPVWVALRERGEQGWPRTVNVITGPSRTADIELTIQLGAHGPRSLHVLLVD
ncbi:LUD domain-containing protein [Thioalkalivibrio sp.]|uniref:LutC/YkgG family protein n=1 Tax=Thioalkalivibrio sp. TaxID=2093813 RepID=UPI0012D63E17|nr:LUD domain-containing protein [Thioalkalivibrio sp.]TVP78500.1 MAG: lactate utilization protein [Thioalkalivibrio sp.]